MLLLSEWEPLGNGAGFAVCYILPCVKHYSEIEAHEHPAFTQDLNSLRDSSAVGKQFTLTAFER